MGLWHRLFNRPRATTPTSLTHEREPLASDLDASRTAEQLTRLRRVLADGQYELVVQEVTQQIEQAKDATNMADLHLLRAQALRQSGKPIQALEDCEVALLKTTDPSLVQLEMAQCWLAVPDLEAAIDALHVAVTLDDTNGAAWLLLGETWRRLEQQHEAQAAYRHATEHLLTPHEKAQAWVLLGQSFMYTVDVVEAQHAFLQARELDPDLVGAHVGLGNAALWLDEEPTAVEHYEVAMRLSPRPGRLLLLNYASALQSSGRFEDAQRIFQRVVAEQPNDHTSRWYLCQLDLALCDWRSGWPNYPTRFGSGATVYRPMPFAPWDGRPAPEDTLLVLADEGLGDEIMYASCIEQAARRVRHLIVECEPRLEKLFKRSFPNVHVVGTRRENDSTWLAGLPRPDWQIPSGDLPGIFRLQESDFSDHAGYLKADPLRTESWRQRLADRLGPGLKVGISWRGGTIKTRTRARSLSADLWQPILSVPGVSFVNLQYGDYTTELAALRDRHGVEIHDFPEAIADYDETAALVASLDLVITVCTAIVHLAGSLGKPVWVLTPLAPGWRYTAHRDRMPWYPSSRLFRQKKWGEWPPVCQEVSTELARLTGNVSAGRS